MILTYLVAILAFASVNGKSTRDIQFRIFESQINSSLSGIIAGLPDPYLIDQFAFSDQDMSLDLKLSGISIAGLSKIHINQLKVDPLSLLSFGVDVQQLVVDVAEYDFAMKILFLPIYGHGKLSLTLSNLTLAGSGKPNLLPLSVKNLKIDVDANDYNVNLSGIINNEDFSKIISTIINEVLPVYWQKYKDQILNAITQPLEDFLNDKLGNILG